MNMNMDFIKGFSVGIAILILYVFLQPKTGRYSLYSSKIMLDTKTGQTYERMLIGDNDKKWKNHTRFKEE